MADVGSTFKRAREEKGLSLEEVYQKLKIHPRILEALEENRGDLALSATHLKGFLRSYAAFLGLEADPSVQESLKRLAQRRTHPDPAYFEPLAEEEQRGLPPWTTRALVVIFLAGCLYLLGTGLSKVNWSRKDFFEQYPLTRPEAFQPFDRILRISESQPLSLKLSAKANAWVAVKSDDRLVYQGLMTAGQQESRTAQKRFELSVGDGGMVLLELNRRRLGIPGEKGKALEGLVITREGIGIEKPL